MTSQGFYDRPSAGQPSAGIPTGDESRYADGHRQGEVLFRFGTRTDVTRDMPGWFVADGTQPDLIINGTNYGKPNLSKRVVMGADGSAGFAIGNTGGSDGVPAHTHAFTQPNNHVFTQPSAHGITQPVFAAPAAHNITQPTIANNSGAQTHDNNHSITQPTAHGNHGYTLTEFTATGLAAGATGLYAIVKAVGLGLHGDSSLTHTNNHSGTAATAHSDHPVHNHLLNVNVALDHNHDAPARTTDVALTNNHSGGAVDPHTGGAVGAVTSPSTGNYPPYVAVWPLIKVYA